MDHPSWNPLLILFALGCLLVLCVHGQPLLSYLKCWVPQHVMPTLPPFLDFWVCFIVLCSSHYSLPLQAIHAIPMTWRVTVCSGYQICLYNSNSWLAFWPNITACLKLNSVLAQLQIHTCPSISFPLAFPISQTLNFICQNLWSPFWHLSFSLSSTITDHQSPNPIKSTSEMQCKSTTFYHSHCLHASQSQPHNASHPSDLFSAW